MVDILPPGGREGEGSNVHFVHCGYGHFRWSLCAVGRRKLETTRRWHVTEQEKAPYGTEKFHQERGDMICCATLRQV